MKACVVTLSGVLRALQLGLASLAALALLAGGAGSLRAQEREAPRRGQAVQRGSEQRAAGGRDALAERQFFEAP